MCRLMKTANAVAFSSVLLAGLAVARAGEGWTQYKYDAHHSGNVPERNVTIPLGLIGAAPCTDAIFTAPVVANGRVFVVDGSGVAHCLDAETLEVVWEFASAGGNANCNNVSSPAIAGRYLHFGTMAGSYYVLNVENGQVVKEIPCGEPIFNTPVVANNRVYFATLGSKVYALEPDGKICWTWDYVKEVLKFNGNRWSGTDWLKHKGSRVLWNDQFLCSRDMAVNGKMVVLPAGSAIAWLEDAGSKAVLLATHRHSRKATFGLTLDESGTVYWQWVQKDNTGGLRILRLKDGKVETNNVRGTEGQTLLPSSLSFCSISLRGKDAYRCMPDENFSFSKHSLSGGPRRYLGGYPSIAPPLLLRDTAVYGGLDGRLYLVPLSGKGKVWSSNTTTPF